MNNEKTPILHHEEKKRLIAQLVVSFGILLIIVAISFIFSRYNTKTEAPVNVDTQQTPNELGIIKIEDKTAPYLDISAEYPTTGVGSAYVKQNVLDIIQAFKTENDFSKYTPTELENIGLSADRQYQLAIKYVNTEGKNTVTHRIDSYAFTGGAHGGNFVETYTFTPDEKILAITDLFTDSTKGLDLVSKKTVDYIKNNPDYKDGLPTAWFDEGVAPTAENYAAYELTKDTLVIIFQQYQALPYVYGNIEIPIKLTELSAVLKPEFK